MNNERNIIAKQIIGHIISIAKKYSYLEKAPQSFHPNIKIYSSQAQMLISLAQLKRPNITELSKYLAITKASVVETIDKLQKKKLVFRSKNPDNEKEVFIELSANGKKISRTINRNHTRMVEDLITSIKKEKGIDYSKVCKMLVNIELFFDTYLDKSSLPVQNFKNIQHPATD